MRSKTSLRNVLGAKVGFEGVDEDFGFKVIGVEVDRARNAKKPKNLSFDLFMNVLGKNKKHIKEKCIEIASLFFLKWKLLRVSKYAFLGGYCKTILATPASRRLSHSLQKLRRYYEGCTLFRCLCLWLCLCLHTHNSYVV